VEFDHGTRLGAHLFETSHCGANNNDLVVVTEEETSEMTTTKTSSLVGMYMDPYYCKQGWTKHILGIWLHLCQQARLLSSSPLQTEIMHKPLLSLVLQHMYGFQPLHLVEGVNVVILLPPSLGNASVDTRDGGGADQEMEKKEGDEKSVLHLYSYNKCLEGVFMLWHM